jgi:hypothetical protein
MPFIANSCGTPLYHPLQTDTGASTPSGAGEKVSAAVAPTLPVLGAEATEAEPVTDQDPALTSNAPGWVNAIKPDSESSAAPEQIPAADERPKVEPTISLRPRAKWKQFLGSTVAFWLGIFVFLGPLITISQGESIAPSGLIGGPVMILGALACRSAKKRKLGLAKHYRARLLGEIVSLISLLSIVLLQKNAIELIYRAPWPNVLMPIWVFVAYGIAIPKRRVLDAHKATANQLGQTTLPNMVPSGGPSEVTGSTSEASPKTCPLCHLTNPVSSEKCDCGYNFITGQGIIGVAYARLGSRFLAYLGDLAVIYFGVITGAGIYALIKPFSITDAADRLITYSALVLYMTIGQAIYHTTIGKYILGLEVRSSVYNDNYPGLGRILLRETLGRLFSSFFFGVGYWGSAKPPQYQAWSDRMADTVVCKRQTNRILSRALTAFVIMACIYDVGVFIWSHVQAQIASDRQSFLKEYSVVTDELKLSREAANDLIARKVDNLEQWQNNMRGALQKLDTYDAQLKRVSNLIQQALSNNLLTAAGERDQFSVIVQVFELRGKQSSINRREAEMVIKHDSGTTDINMLISQIQLLDSDIESLDTQAKKLLATIGAK